MRIIYKYSYFFFLLAIIASSCTKKNGYNSNADVIKEWNFTISSSNENSVSTGAEITALFHMVVLADNSINYDVHIDSASDKIAAAQIGLGDPVTDGRILLNLPVRVYSTYASGVVTGLSQGFIDTLLNNNIDKYINVTSGKAPAGLVRGQLNSTIILSKNVSLMPGAVVPAATNTATGTAFIRLTADNILFSKVIINNDPADPVTTATINSGAANANGPVVVTIASSAADFGVAKKYTVSASAASTLAANSTYIIANSVGSPNGKIRGQIK